MKEQSANLRAAESSRQTQPAWLYRITFQGDVYFFTGYDKDITIDNGPGGLMSDPQVFTSVPIDHQPPKEAADINSQPTSVALAANDTLLRRYFVSAPTGEIGITIWRVNSATLPGPIEYADLYQDFKGICQSVAFAGYQIEASFLAPVQQEDRTVGNFFYQKTCNYKLGGVGCGVNRENFKLVTTLAAVDRISKTVTIEDETMMAGSPSASITISAETFQGGELVDAAGNRIGIVACEVLESGERRLWLGHWPGTLTVSASVTLYMGCIKIVRVCEDTFNNKANFGGFPYIPVTNPSTNSIIT